MRVDLATQRAWLTVEPLPADAPELNPVEPLWGKGKGRELANHCAADLDDVTQPLRAGMRRIRGHSPLVFSFRRHAGLSL